MKRYVFILLTSLSFCVAPQTKDDAKAAQRNQQPQADGTTQDDDFFFNEQANTRSPSVKATANNEVGYASWYGKELQGRPTASGEIFDMNKMTAAHRTFAMGSLVLVKNTENGRKQLVTINDRGPYVEGRIIDVSFAAARELGFAEKGVAKVSLELLQAGQDNFMSKAQLPAKQENDEIALFANVKANEEIIEPEDHTEYGDQADDDFFDDEEPAMKKGATKQFVFSDGQKPKGYTIQIGAFKTRANAERHREEMVSKFGKRCYIGQKDGWHLVLIGDFKDSKKAREYLNKLKQDGVDVMYRGKIT